MDLTAWRDNLTKYLGKGVKTCCARGIEVLVFPNGWQALTDKAFREFPLFPEEFIKADRVWMSEGSYSRKPTSIYLI